MLIISGSGPTDRNGNGAGGDNNSLKFLAEELSKNGFASVRFDKRGIGESKDAMEEESKMRFPITRRQTSSHSTSYLPNTARRK